VTERNYLISVLPENYDEDLLQYSDVVSWSHSNLDHKNVLRLTLEDIYMLDKIWDIVNEENDSMIGPHEDSWIPIQEARIAVLNRLKAYNDTKIGRRGEILMKRILDLLETAVRTNHN